jgi:hypothetical protein
MKKMVYLLLAISPVFVFMRCSDNDDFTVPEEYSWVDTVSLGHQIKGYEIYSWQDGDQWNFNLIYGTNRSKICEEIKNHKFYNEGAVDFKVKGIGALKGLLNRLPQGEYVFWSDGKLVDKNENQCADLVLPERSVINDVENFCKRKGVELIVSH